MKPALHDIEPLIREHRALMRHCAQAQARCSALVREQAAEIDALHVQAMRLRAGLIVRDSALAWAREDHAAREAAAPGLPGRVTWGRRVERLLARLQDLLRPPRAQRLSADDPTAGRPRTQQEAEDLARLEASLVAADLVICQTGCLSHGAYWRVQDHCKRTGKTCVLVAQPDALRIVRIDKPVADTAS